MAATVKEIEASQVKKWHDNGEIILIDVRELLEYTEEHLARAQLFPSSHFKAESLPDPAGKKLVFYCHLGRRSQLAAQKWGDYSGQQEVYSLKGGINAWKQAGYSTVTDSDTSRSVERQIYILCGSLVLLGLILALFTSSWFLLFPAIVGLLLLLSGILGHCPFSFLLSLLPWNR